MTVAWAGVEGMECRAGCLSLKGEELHKFWSGLDGGD